MDPAQPEQSAGVRRLHIAHRRSPSELTPLMMEQLALQQRIDVLNQQQQQLQAAQIHYANQMGMMPQQHLSPQSAYGPIPGQMGHINQQNAFQFPQNQVPQGNPNAGNQQGSHRRNNSAVPNMGPPPAPSSGAAGFENFNQNQNNQSREGSSQRGGRGGHASAGSGHQRRHSLALPEARKAAELAQQKRTTSAFQFPIPGATGTASTSAQDTPSTSTEKQAQSTEPQSTGLSARSGNRGGAHGRSQSMMIGSNNRTGPAGRGFQFPADDSSAQTGFDRRGGHARNSSRNFEGNWRQPQNAQQGEGQTNGQYRPGHRARGSMNQSVGSMNQFQFAGQPQLVPLAPAAQNLLMQQPQLFNAGQLSQMQINQLLQAQLTGQQIPGMPGGQMLPQLSAQQQQQRKTLFTPYLGQANLPDLISSGQLVTGILRVNKKNRSDAYVTTDDGVLDADIFICGSKDRNRALEGDLVAVELLDVDEVWSQKREKEEKKKRKDISDGRSGSISHTNSDRNSRSDSNAGITEDTAPDGSIRRRGSLRQRPTQKKNDDVEVEGQSLLLVEEEELSDEQKPLYAGHIVAVIERVAGQMFSGTLGLLRPSSQATKEKQEAERQAREGANSRPQPDRSQEKPKIVWFKPTDKRVPLIAIPTEQAPRDFVENHQAYSTRIFVACIKRWPITSLHPFGTLVEQLGEMGDLKVETDALLRDNNFGPDEFSENILKSVGFTDWTFESEAETLLQNRRDLREEVTFTISASDVAELDNAFHVKQLADNKTEIGLHVVDVAHFVTHNSVVDREAKKRGSAVHLMNRNVGLFPPKISAEICSFQPGQDRLAYSVIYKVNSATYEVIEDETWIGSSVIKPQGVVSYKLIDSVIAGEIAGLDASVVEVVKTLSTATAKFRSKRFAGASNVQPLRLVYQLDNENTPVEQNIYNASAAHDVIEELKHKVNATVATKLLEALPEQALLRRHASPAPRRFATLIDRLNKLGYDLDTTTSGTLQNGLFAVEDDDLRKGMETILVKSMARAKYFVAGKCPESMRYHYGFNVPLYTHFTNPLGGYADMIVQRQLQAVLSDGAIKFEEDVESLSKLADQCNTKKDSAKNAQEQSVHIEACRSIDRDRASVPGDFVVEGVVLCVYESAFDVLIPEFGFEKRVHCDQLPLKKAEFDKNKRILELYWEKGIPSSSYVPEDERPRPGQSQRAKNAAAAQLAKEQEDAQRRQMDTGSMATDDVDALFDDDEDLDDIAESTAGVSLDAHNRPTQSMPGSPTRGAGQAPHRTQSDPKLASSAADSSEQKQSLKERYLAMFTLREQNGDYIQDVKEMTRVPIILKTDLTKSPPCLTIRSINPYAL